MGKPNYLLEIAELFVFSHLFNSGVSHVARFSAEWENSKRIAADNAQAGNRERLGRVSLGDD